MEVAASRIRRFVSPAVLLAALLAGSRCMPSAAFHDGLPAWVAAPDKVEWRAGYQQIWVASADSIDFAGERRYVPNLSIGYLTPGMRVGLKRRKLAAEVGFASAIKAQDGFSAMLGGDIGLGYNDPKFSLMFRPSLYLLNIYSNEADGTGAAVGYWTQVSLLAGNGYRARGVNFALGGRANPYSAGPLAVIGYNLSSVEYRAELSFMVPVSIYAAGRALTVGITVATPTKPPPER